MVLAMLCFVAPPAAATRDFMAAGILLVADDGQSPMVLLVRHHSRSWYEMPGGRRQVNSGAESGQDGRRETAYQTAVREVYEETRRYLSHDLLRTVVDASHNIRDGGFVFFVGKIDRFPVTGLPDTPRPNDANASAFSEIADYAWVPVENVFAGDDTVVADADGRRIKVRRQLKSRLQQARAAGWL